MKSRILLTTFVITLVALFAGCKRDDFREIDSQCPTVMSTNPANGETGVLFNQTLTATFNEEMDPASITSSSFTLQGATPISGSVAYAGKTAFFNPTNNLSPNTTYIATLTTAVKDPFGNFLQKKFVWSFSTGATLSPVVFATDPLDNATNVVLNKRITASFNMPMDPQSIYAATFKLRAGATAVNGDVSYEDSTASFVPSAPLLSNTLYTATLTTGIRNSMGNPLATEHEWTFTTGNVSAPTVISTDPDDDETNVPLNKTVTVTFSEPMDPNTIDTNSIVIMSGTTAVVGNLTYAGNTATFTPDANLYSETTYTGRVKFGAKNTSGVSLANEYVWSFTTVGHLGPKRVDLQSVARFGIIAATAVTNNSGPSKIHDMDVGISPGVRASITGFPPAVVLNGGIYASDDQSPSGVADMLQAAKQDLKEAYLFAEGSTSPAPATIAGDLGGTTLTPGIYKSTSTVLIQSGDLTLDGQGDINSTWIFQVASDLTTVGGAGGNVILMGGAQAKNVFWQIGSSATIGEDTEFGGNVLALTSITMNSGATAHGRMLARNGAVVLTNSNIIRP